MDFPATATASLRKDLHEWIAAIATPDPRLGGHAPCPFAHLAQSVSVVETTGEIVPPDRPFDAIVYSSFTFRAIHLNPRL